MSPVLLLRCVFRFIYIYISEVNLKVKIDDIIAPPEGFVRDYVATSYLRMRLSYEGAILPTESVWPDSFRLQLYVAPNTTKTAAGNFSEAEIYLNELAMNQSVGPPVRGMKLYNTSEEWTLDINVSTTIPNDICRDMEFLCLRLTSTREDLYIELQPQDNLDCFGIKQDINCWPGKFMWRELFLIV